MDVARREMAWEVDYLREAKNAQHFRYILRAFAPIVSAHLYCARNSLRDVMPRHALSSRAVEEMWRYIALVGTLIYLCTGLTLLNIRRPHIFF